MTSFFTEIRSNKIRSGIIILCFFLFVLGVGAFIGYVWLGQREGSYAGVFLSLIVGGLYFLIAWFAGNKIILSTTGAKPVTKKQYPYLYNTVEGLSIAAGIPMPKVYVIEDSALNAYATGRDPKNAAIVVTTGLLQKMNRQELEGVIGHEMSHIKNYDSRVMMLAAVLVGVLTLLSDLFLRSFLWRRSDDRDFGNAQVVLIVIGVALVILSPLIGYLVQLAISRRREYLADASGAMLTRYPPGLASALRKIAKDPDPLVDNANRATAHLFISTPFRKRSGFFTNLFSTHPPIEERIKRLEKM